MRKRQDNRGSSMLIVIVAIAFVSILIATSFMMSVINIQMKSVDRKVKENFYSAEGALEQISIGLQNLLSDESTEAYSVVMKQYASTTLEVERRNIFNGKLLGDIKDTLQNGNVDQYDLNILRGFITEEVRNQTELSSTKNCALELGDDSLLLKGLVVTYTDTQGYQSVIETDIRLTAPDLNLIQPADMPDLFEYAIVANTQLIGDNGGSVSIGANVYAGDGGMTLTPGAAWEFTQANRVVVSGEVQIPTTAQLEISTDMDLWAKQLNVTGGTLQTKGRTYVANDLVMNGQGSNVTLEGEYYGYGNKELLTDAGLFLPESGDSSAILINGTQTTLDMMNMRRLLLSGSAQIATGKLTFDESAIESLLPENPPSLDDNKARTSLTARAYYFKAMGNGMLVSSQDNYVSAQTAGDTKVVDGSWERFLLTNNDDGTISLKDPNNPNHRNKYVSVQTDDQNILLANADEVGPNEKFYLYTVEKDGNDYYALQSYANGKFVSLDTYYRGDEEPVNNVLCANRDKITDDGQLFRVYYHGRLPQEQIEAEPAIVFNYISDSQVDIVFAAASWANNGYDSEANANITYTKINSSGDSETITGAAMSAPSGSGTLKRRVTYSVEGISAGTTIHYTISYKNNDGSWGELSGIYTHFSGNYGNAGDRNAPQLVNGIYRIRLGKDGKFCQVDNYGDNPLQFSKDDPADNTTSWEWFHLINHADGTISLKSQLGDDTNQRYVSIQPDGTLIANSNTVGVNEKFNLVYVFEDGNVYYQLKTLARSSVGEKVWYVTDNNQKVGLAGSTEVQSEKANFTFQWWAYSTEESTEETTTGPVIAFDYERDEDNGTNNLVIGFADKSWYGNPTQTDFGATLSYTIRGTGTTVENVEMTKRDYTGSRRRTFYRISDLAPGTVIDYTITYKLLGEYEGQEEVVTGTYTFESGYGNAGTEDLELVNGLYWIRSARYDRNMFGYWRAAYAGNGYIHSWREAGYGPTEGDGSYELFYVLQNGDGTISFQPFYMSNDKYLSIQADGTLQATATGIGVNERFRLEPVAGTEGYYQIQTMRDSIGAGKYLYVNSDSDVAEERKIVLRDKAAVAAENASQGYFAFEWKEYTERVGDEEVLNPQVYFTYENYQAGANVSDVVVNFADPYWGTAGAPADHKVSLTYTVVGTNQQNTVDMTWHSCRRSTYYKIASLKKGDVVNYTITYTPLVGTIGQTKQVSGTYAHRPGYGNTASGKMEMGNGVYFIRGAAFDRSKAAYWWARDNGAAALQCGKQNPADVDTSWEKMILVNNGDKTISLKTWSNRKYVSIQADGTLKPTADSIGVNERFVLEYVGGDEGYYRLRTLDTSRGEGKYIYVKSGGENDTDVLDYDSRLLVLRDKSNNPTEDSLGYFCFEWVEYSSEVGSNVKAEIPNYYPDGNMKYKDEETASVTFTSPYWTGLDGESVTLSYEIGGLEYPEIVMGRSNLVASCIIPNLWDGDRVTYRFTYKYRTAYGTWETGTTADNIYIHQRKYGEMVDVDSTNENVNLGESLEVKSNQIAYLVPPECIGVNNGETIIGKNPMSALEFTKMMSYANNTTTYPDFEVVSFDTVVEGLGKTLAEYRTEGTDGYRTIFVQTTGATGSDTMVYFYVDFSSDNASKYFRDYYAKNQSALEGYMKNYVTEIKLSSRFTRLTTDGNMVYSAVGNTGRIDLRSNVGFGAYLTELERSSLLNEEESYQKRFKALTTKLMLDFDELSMAERANDVFDNLIKYSEGSADGTVNGFANIHASTTPITYSLPIDEENSIKAFVVNNKNAGVYHYNGDPKKEVCLILATGDVVLEQDFSGIVIARGTVTVNNDDVDIITGNKENLFKILQTVTNPDDENPKTILERYFKDGEKYILNDDGEQLFDGDYASYSNLVTYEEWTKR